MFLPDHLLSLPSLQALHRLRNRLPRREDGSALRRLVVDVHDRAARGPVLLQERLDRRAGGWSIGDLEEPGSVFFLRVDDDEGGVGSGRGGGRDADEFTE